MAMTALTAETPPMTAVPDRVLRVGVCLVRDDNNDAAVTSAT